jgi:hypothetical protein
MLYHARIDDLLEEPVGVQVGDDDAVAPLDIGGLRPEILGLAVAMRQF